VQAVIGLAVLIGSFLFRETIQRKNNIGVVGALMRLATLLRHSRFTVMVVLFSLPGICLMAYVSASTYIYQEQFGLDNYQYGILFGVCSAGAMAGPFIYMATSARLSRLRVILFSFAAIAAVGVVTFAVGESSIIHFAVLMFALGLMCSMTRPAGAFLVLNYHEGDSGSSSALMGALSSFMGSLGMAIVTVHPRYVLVIGVVSVAVGVVCTSVWLALSRKYDVG
jgi:DHA1 family bicyclomycin/chloramphenicol resistance-like MFS transporter